MSNFAIYSDTDNSLIFYSNDTVPSSGDTYNGKTITNVYTGFDDTIYSSESSVPWYSIRENVKIVSFDRSFICVPVSIAFWFSRFTNCEEINGTKYLNMENVTTAEYAFYHCENITNLDVSTWNTKNITNMKQMLSYLNKITFLDLSNFNTSNVTAMNGMLRGSELLEKINLSNFDTSKVIEINAFIRECPKLTTIYATNDWNTDNATNDANMFVECPLLTGGNGTKYDSSKVDSSMARIDTKNTQGYFTYPKRLLFIDSNHKKVLKDSNNDHPLRKFKEER